MPRPPQRTQDFFGSYGPEPVAIHDARRAFATWLEPLVAEGELLDEMLVVLSELMANAADASEQPQGDITVRAWLDADGLSLEVTNPPASTFAAVNRWDYDDPLRTGGRGLIIVESLVDDIAIAPPNGPEPLTVRCRRELPSDP
jgi:anti-sigma regulatory factor (Ser/Thr protein kinase)